MSAIFAAAFTADFTENLTVDFTTDLKQIYDVFVTEDLTAKFTPICKVQFTMFLDDFTRFSEHQVYGGKVNFKTIIPVPSSF